MDYCFDTSGLNRLHDDKDREFIVAGLLATNNVLQVDGFPTLVALPSLNKKSACG
jgi:hypothetical protein